MHMLHRGYYADLTGLCERKGSPDSRDDIHIRAHFNEYHIFMFSHSRMTEMEKHINPACKHRIYIAGSKARVSGNDHIRSRLFFDFPGNGDSLPFQSFGELKSSLFAVPVLYDPEYALKIKIELFHYDFLAMIYASSFSDSSTLMISSPSDMSFVRIGSVSLFFGSFSTKSKVPSFFNAGSTFRSAFMDDRGLAVMSMSTTSNFSLSKVIANISPDSTVMPGCSCAILPSSERNSRLNSIPWTCEAISLAKRRKPPALEPISSTLSPALKRPVFSCISFSFQ